MIGVGSGSATLQYLKFSSVMSDLSISQMKPITGKIKKRTLKFPLSSVYLSGQDWRWNSYNACLVLKVLRKKKSFKLTCFNVLIFKCISVTLNKHSCTLDVNSLVGSYVLLFCISLKNNNKIHIEFSPLSINIHIETLLVDKVWSKKVSKEF